MAACRWCDDSSRKSMRRRQGLEVWGGGSCQGRAGGGGQVEGLKGGPRGGGEKGDLEEGALRDVRRALLEADVSLPVVRRCIKEVEEQAVGLEVGSLRAGGGGRGRGGGAWGGGGCGCGVCV